MGNIRFITSALLALLWTVFLPAQSLPEWARGSWVVSAPSGSFRGEKVSFETDSFSLFYNMDGPADAPFLIEPTTCPEPLYETDWEDARGFQTVNQQDFSELTGVYADSIPVFRIYCIDPKMSASVYFVKKNRLLLTYLGLVCHLKPERKWWFFGKK